MSLRITPISEWFAVDDARTFSSGALRQPHLAAGFARRS